MPKQYFFSINLLIKDNYHINETVSSIISDEKFFLENVQLILVDSVCSEESIAICSGYSEKFPDNIFFLDTSGKKTASSYNDSYPVCTGKYISFIDNYGEYSKKALSVLYNILNDNEIDIDIALIKPLAHSKPYINDIASGMVSLKDTPDNFILMLGCYFFSKEICDNIEFDSKLKFHAEDKFIIQSLLQTYSFLFTENCSYTSLYPTEHDIMQYQPQYSKFFYTHSVNDFIIPMLKSFPESVFVKSAMTYLIDIKFSLNQDNYFKDLLDKNSVKDFFNSVRQALKLIDDGIILNPHLCSVAGLDTEFPFSLIKLKYDNPDMIPDTDLVLFKDTIEKKYFSRYNNLKTYTLNGELAFSINQAYINSSKNIFAEISAINFKDGLLYIDAFLQNASYLNKDFSIYALINQTKTDILASEIYNSKTFFDNEFIKKFSFTFSVPVSSGKQIDTVCIILTCQNLSFRIDMRFRNVFSRLSEIKSSFWRFSDRVLSYDEKTRSLVIRRATESLITLNENKFMSQTGKMLSFTETLHYRQLRKNIRHISKEKNNMKYFVFYDDFGINSNGNLLFRYFSKSKKDKNFIPFFIADKNSPEYSFLTESNYENILEKHSKKAKSIILSADVIFASDCNVYNSLGFSKNDMIFLRDYFNAEIFSVKNCFMTSNTPQFDNRLKDNISKYFCASNIEKQNLLQKQYGYSDNMIETTGYPILDSTFNEKENLILLAPGNRKSFSAFDYSNFNPFSESKFFKTYNSILTDEKLNHSLSENKFKLAVLMPPAIEKYMHSFDSNDNISFYSYTEKNIALLIGKAAVIITDYSELIYKMAYLNKPVIYYLPKNLPVQSESKIYDLQNSSLGEIFTEHDSLINHLTKNIPLDFTQPENYKQRCADFFIHKDNKNCRRIFESVETSELNKTID